MATQAEASTSQPRIKHLVLDAGPLLSLAPLRGLAQHYYTTPQIVGELKDPRARQHFENLGITAGVLVQIRQPDLLSVAQVTAMAKKTGDYSVLSAPDLGVIALTHSLAADEAADGPQETLSTEREAEDADEGSAEEGEESSEEEEDADTLHEELENLDLDGHAVPAEDSTAVEPSESADVADDPPSDGEGEWITPSNVSVHKSRARELLPSSASAGREDGPMIAACMTSDYAVQNVLLHMGLNLVSVEGKRITKVKSWVLRCHACFKICKDPSKKFCPSCGNATLLRTSVSTIAPSPDSPSQEPTFQVHLKPNFQYRTRGTKYSIPLPKPGQAKGGGTGGSGLVLTEDQVEFQRALLREKGRQAKEQRAMDRAVEAVARGERPRGEGTWDDPDWVPGMLLGEGGRKRGGGLPTVGHGRRNPNEARRKKR
ncbi:hypothetical protein CALVIDRAFT_496667 [Calocera viscosa TUFC12733]|uniref:20S-pre-rRNA D-site endonuclease NOB1 n=1 Tax=Calocera viscosa (strain TUFC12733) TaxID=1330018 RepID=A0A167NUU0_CALVF|nr:hypothetical protein CALVIDRAFT_496667 [Calocera viscosa TUFC12733]